MQPCIIDKPSVSDLGNKKQQWLIPEPWSHDHGHRRCARSARSVFEQGMQPRNDPPCPSAQDCGPMIQACRRVDGGGGQNVLFIPVKRLAQPFYYFISQKSTFPLRTCLRNHGCGGQVKGGYRRYLISKNYSGSVRHSRPSQHL